MVFSRECQPVMEETLLRVEGPKVEKDLLSLPVQSNLESTNQLLKKFKISSKKDFENLRVKPKIYKCRSFKVFYKKNKEQNPRFAFSVSRKVGNAVLRNKVKRTCRELIRKYPPLIKNDYLMVINPNIFKDKENLLNSFEKLNTEVTTFLMSMEHKNEKRTK